MATIRQLEAFIATAEFKKMSEAAKHLYISQPTISQIIAELEKEYDTKLFERHTKELRITPAGMLLLKSAREIISIHKTLKQEMKTISSIHPLRVGATMTVGANIMGKIVSRMNELYPDIDITVNVTNTETIEQLLLENELDVALVEGVITHSKLMAKPVLLDKLCLICGKDHPFAGSTCLRAEDLRNQNFILREKGSGTRAIFESFMRMQDIPYQVKWESNSTPAIIDAISRNLGLGFLSERCVYSQAAAGLICCCPVQDFTLERFFYICYSRSTHLTTQVKEFCNYVSSLPKDFH